ncbi:MAG: hypothetical protein JW910_16620, partial [Anaerolineae bacterium]|nr:hypothetical protein [Anaerolineae bacterium]
DPTRYPSLWRGKWTPADTESTRRFLEQLERGRAMWVEYGRRVPRELAMVEHKPGGEIELRLGLDDSETLHVRT